MYSFDMHFLDDCFVRNLNSQITKLYHPHFWGSYFPVIICIHDDEYLFMVL